MNGQRELTNGKRSSCGVVEMPGRWLTVGEVAAMMQVSEDTVARQIRAGFLRAKKLGSARCSPVRIREDWLLEWQEAR